MFLFYVLSFFKKGDIIQGGTVFKEILYTFFFSDLAKVVQYKLIAANAILEQNQLLSYYSASLVPFGMYNHK